MFRCACWPERFDDDQTPAAAGAREREEARPVRCVGSLGVGRRRGSGEQFADAGDIGGAITIAEEPVVADSVLALGEHVDEEAADEFVRLQRHGGVAAGPVDPVVLDPEGDAVGTGPDQAAVGNRHAMGVTVAESRISPASIARAARSTGSAGRRQASGLSFANPVTNRRDM